MFATHFLKRYDRRQDIMVDNKAIPMRTLPRCLHSGWSRPATELLVLITAVISCYTALVSL